MSKVLSARTVLAAAEEVERPRLDASQEFSLWCAGNIKKKKYAPTVNLLEMRGRYRAPYESGAVSLSAIKICVIAMRHACQMSRIALDTLRQ